MTANMTPEEIQILVLAELPDVPGLCGAGADYGLHPGRSGVRHR
jgi:hypothetical protein